MMMSLDVTSCQIACLLSSDDSSSFQPSAQVKEQLQESDAQYTSHFFNVPAYLTVSGQLHLEVMSG